MMETYLISPSQFRAHKECPWKHKYVYEMKLRPKGRQAHFEVGSYFHELSHYYYQLLKSGYKVGDTLTINAMDTKLRNDLQEVHPDYGAVLLQVHIVFRRYLNRRSEELDTGIEILDVEKELELEIEHLPGVGLMGIVDLIYKKKGRVVIRDHKTGQNKSSHSAEGMDFEDQLLTYACMYWKLTGIVPDIEISWVNSKATYSTHSKPPTNDQLFGLYRKVLTKEYLEAYWQYTLDYIYHMQSVPAIRYINSFKCKSCPFKDPCSFSMRGLDTENMIKANYVEVSRDHDYAKFTELARKNPSSNEKDSTSGDNTGGFDFNLNFS